MEKKQTKEEQKPQNTGENREEIKRDKKGRFVEGVSGNPDGKPKGAISLLAILKELLQEMIKEKTSGEKKQKARALMEIYLKKAIADEDKDIIKDIINRIDGMPKQTIGFDPEDAITELRVNIIRNKKDVERIKRDNSLQQNTERVGEEDLQKNNLGGRDGIKQDDILVPTDGDDNAEGEEKADNDSQKDTAISEGDGNEGLSEHPEGIGGV